MPINQSPIRTLKFSKKEAIKFGWEKVMANFWSWVLIMAVYIGLNYLPAYLLDKTPYQGDFTDLIKVLLTLAVFALNLIMALGLIRVTLKVYDNQVPRVEDLFNDARYIFRFFGATLLYGLMVLGGLLLFIVPGVIWLVKYYFVPYFILEGNEVFNAFHKSARLTKDSKGNLFVLFLLLFLIGILDALVLGIGLVIATPIVSLAITYVYRKLKEQTQNTNIELDF